MKHCRGMFPRLARLKGEGRAVFYTQRPERRFSRRGWIPMELKDITHAQVLAARDDIRVRNEIITASQDAIQKVSRLVAAKGTDRRNKYLECVQEASLYMVTLIRNFKPRDNTKFGTYVCRALWLYLHNRRIRDSIISIRHNEQGLTEAAKLAREAARSPKSFNPNRREHQNCRIEQSPRRFDGHQQDLVDEVHEAMRVLSDKERRVVLGLTSGIQGRQLAEEMGVPEAHVWYLRRISMQKVRKALELAA